MGQRCAGGESGTGRGDRPPSHPAVTGRSRIAPQEGTIAVSTQGRLGRQTRRPRPPRSRRILSAGLGGASVASFGAYVVVLVGTESSAWASLLALAVVVSVAVLAEVCWAPSRRRIAPTDSANPP